MERRTWVPSTFATTSKHHPPKSGGRFDLDYSLSALLHHLDSHQISPLIESESEKAWLGVAAKVLLSDTCWYLFRSWIGVWDISGCRTAR